MHLGLIDGPFIPHKLISAQESPVPILKFQMAPRLKILMASGSKKGTQMHFPLKSPDKQIPFRFSNRALMERDTRLQGNLYISQKPYLSGSPVKEPCPKVPFMEPLAERCPTTRALLYSYIKVPGTGSPSPHARKWAPIAHDIVRVFITQLQVTRQFTVFIATKAQ